MAGLFGTNGVRGVFGADLTLELVHDVTLAAASYFEDGLILVGYDGRKTSPLISKVVCSALNYAGLDCGAAGLVPTPALEFAVKSLGYRGGIMITASHNPPQYNGIKLVARDGVEISREDERVVEDTYTTKRYRRGTDWGKTSAEPRVLGTYLDGVCRQINTEMIMKRRYTVVLDLGNGAQAIAAPELAGRLGCTVHTINGVVDGEFPGRGSEPTPANLGALTRAVLENGADLGIAFDGDGDRSMLCDELGTILTGDRSALLLSGFLLERSPEAKIVTCVNSGLAIEDVAGRFSSDVIRTKVGSVEVSRRMVLEDALIGFEENGGFMFGPHNQVRDGCMTLALALDMMAHTGRSISSGVAGLPPSYTAKDRISCTPQQARGIIAMLKSEHPGADTADGIRIPLGRREWVMIRPSGTEPVLRVYAESDSRENLGRLISGYVSRIRSALDAT